MLQLFGVPVFEAWTNSERRGNYTLRTATEASRRIITQSRTFFSKFSCSIADPECLEHAL